MPASLVCRTLGEGELGPIKVQSRQRSRREKHAARLPIAMSASDLAPSRWMASIRTRVVSPRIPGLVTAIAMCALAGQCLVIVLVLTL
jgi:hypothetical protein